MRPTVGLGTLRHLHDLETHGQPVLSVYVDLDGAPSAATELDAELGGLLARAGAGDRDADRVRELLRVRPDFARDGHGLAIFSSARSGVLETVALPSHVKPMAIVDTAAWVEPLVEMVTADDWGVVVVSQRVARLFRGGPRALVEFATTGADAGGDEAESGRSRSRSSDSDDSRVCHHARRAAERLVRADQQRAFDRLVVVALDELWPAIRASLRADLRNRLTAHIVLDLSSASADAITSVVAPIVQEAERSRERALLRSLWEGLTAGDAAVVGVDAVLASLEQRRVDTLMVAAGARLTAGRCPRCGWLSCARENCCPLDGALLEPIDAVECATERARDQRADVVVFSDETAGLCQHGSIAALLREDASSPGGVVRTRFAR